MDTPTETLPDRVLQHTARVLSGPRLHRQLRDLELSRAEHGYDVFGAHPDWVRLAAGLLRGLYEGYFRVTSKGAENIPASGGAILAANHSGTLPFDGAMIWADVLGNTSPPRVVRAIADHFVQGLPFIGTLFARVGTVGGSRGNVRYLLSRGELLLVFPEGVPGIGKPFWERYKLRAWRVGHVEMAIRHHVPVVPTAVVGAEEQMPLIGRIPVHAFGIPFIPLTLTPLPLPVRYHIAYGKPLPLHEKYSPTDADDPEILSRAAEEVRDAVAMLIDEGLERRRGVFR